MTRCLPIHRFLLAGFACLLVVSQYLFAAGQAEIVPPGFRPVPPGVHALTGGTVVVKPGVTISDATILIRDGRIEKVGANIKPPADARVWDMTGMTIYAGFIDPYLTFGAKTTARTARRSDGLTAGGVKFFGVNPQEREPGTEGPGYEVARVTPEKRAVETFSPEAKTLEQLRDLGFTVGNFTPDKGIFRGTSALAALSDADPNRAIIKADVFQNVAFDLDHRKEDTYPESLMGAVAVIRQTFMDAQHYALDQADNKKHPQARKRPEFNPGLEALAQVMEKKISVVFDPADGLMVDRVTRIAHEANVKFIELSSGQEWRRPELAKAAGVPFIVPLDFPTLPKMPSDDDWEQVSLDQLRAWDWAAENPAVLVRQGLEVALTTSGLAEKKDFRKNLRAAIERGLAEDKALAALTTIPAKLCGVDAQMGTVEAGKAANLTIVDGKGYFDADSKVKAVWIDGVYYRSKEESEKETKDKSSADKSAITSTGEKPDADKDKEEKKQADKEKKQAELKELRKRLARSPLDGRGPLTNPPSLLIRNATLWTCGPQGKIDHADLFMQKGKIVKVGKELFAAGHPPKDTDVIDGDGLQVTPGIIDCHSHSMILGNVNEGTLPATAMVRIGDVVNSEASAIYEQLAGGVTSVNLLHGSANPIGGQNQVIKLRDGSTPEEMKFEGAIQGIKFALGENVKQSNWGDKNVTRFPQTRMGVRTFIANRFTAARQYLNELAEFRRSGGVPPRRDLELEAIGEIIEGKRLIHCHSYRQDEILMLIRLMDQFHVRIGTFQHVLEGYKVADEIAKHGAGGSTFADWWAYKFEVYDAIPYNGSVMHDRGVVVSFNSDSSDLARHLYLEAAKAVKFGGTPEEEALKFVTLNPAEQLRIDKRVGSLEAGKDADFAIWSRDPLDSATVCQQTWIDGKKYFDITQSAARAEALAKERADLIAKAKKLSEVESGKSGGGSDDKGGFFSVNLEHEFDGIVRHCLDGEND